MLRAEQGSTRELASCKTLASAAASFQREYGQLRQTCGTCKVWRRCETLPVAAPTSTNRCSAHRQRAPAPRQASMASLVQDALDYAAAAQPSPHGQQTKETTVWMDGAFDVMHFGHANAFRRADARHALGRGRQFVEHHRAGERRATLTHGRGAVRRGEGVSVCG